MHHSLLGNKQKAICRRKWCIQNLERVGPMHQRTFASRRLRIVGLLIGILAILSVWCSPKPGMQILSIASAATVTHGPYTTQFLLTENPISLSNQWISGGVIGGLTLWGDVRTNGTMALGASEPTQYGDPTAILAGTWGPTQTATGVVKVNSTPSSCCHEVEVRLRTSISANRITGYEVLCPVHSSPGYGIQIVRWNGPNGQFVYINAGNAHQCVNGDVLKATATGSNPTTIKVYINGTLIVTGVDHGTETGPGGAAGPWTTGSPGIGFYDNSDSNWSSFGLSSFTATDDSTAQLPVPPTNLTVTVQ